MGYIAFCQKQPDGRYAVHHFLGDIDMTARNATLALSAKITKRTGALLSFNAANTLRRAELTLHRWSEKECRDGNDRLSWAIERDEKTGLPYQVNSYHDGKVTKRRIPDLEKGALNRIEAICKDYELHYYHQTDPRGCALYVANEPLTDINYTDGVACS
jgi:hypothetical protein